MSAGGSDGPALGGVGGRYLLVAGAVCHLSEEGAGIPADSGGTGERNRRCIMRAERRFEIDRACSCFAVPICAF